MEKIELNLVALTNSESHTGQFALILEDVEMRRRIPVTIGAIEAQAIAMVVEKMKPIRPQTHDLFYNTMKSFNAKLEEVIIDEVVDNRYHSKLVFTRNTEKIVVDARTSDAIALAVRFECPVYTFDYILEQTGFSVDTKGLASLPATCEDADQARVTRYLGSCRGTILAQLLNKCYTYISFIGTHVSRARRYSDGVRFEWSRVDRGRWPGRSLRSHSPQAA